MNTDYSFLADELAVLEIKKHKWIESQKKGCELGFASAAVDWIKKYGNDFKSFRLSQSSQDQEFLERRTFRRFGAPFPVRLTLRGVTIEAQTQDLNIIGFSCNIPCFLPHNTAAHIEIDLPGSKDALRFSFKSTIRRVAKSRYSAYESYHHIFIPFTERERNFLRAQLTTDHLAVN